MSGFELNDFRKGSGLILEHKQGAEAVPAYSLVYIDSNGQWALADADAIATMPTVGLTTEALVADKKGRVVIIGLAGLSTWSWTPGDEIYASATAGELTQTAPTGAIAQVVGIAISDTEIFFNPSGFGNGGNIDYEETTEPIAEPTTTAKGNGHIVIQYYTDGQNRTFQWNRSNDAWVGVELL